ELGVSYLAKAGYATEPAPEPVLKWLTSVMDAVRKNLDHLDQLAAATQVIFEYDALARGEEARRLFDEPGARETLLVFIPKILALDEVSYAQFRVAAKATQEETGKKGRELFHPIRVALTGAASGPELEKLVPIFEEGSKLSLPRHVKSCGERLRDFQEITKI
ncbi:MAG: hypothetical protein ACRD10_07745, partial [Terriglobia bacterium]